MKSLSPFVSTILMIALVVGTGTIVYSFFTGALKLPSQQTSSLTEKVISCTGGDFKLYWNKVCQLKDGLVAWYRFDEGGGNYTYDYSGNGNTGTLVNSPTWVQGKFGSALQFNGTNQYATVTTNNLPVGQPSISGTAWIKTASTSISMIVWVYGGTTTASRVGFWLNSGQACFTGAYNNFCAGPNLVDNNWHFLAFTLVGGSTTVYLYIDGVQYTGTISKAITIPTSGNTFYISVDNINTSQASFFNGTIDDVRIYNRALSEEEIKQLYYNGLNNRFNISFTMLYTGVQAQNIGKDFTATIFLSNGTTITKTFSLDNPLGITNTLAKVNLTIDGYYPSYGLIDKITICSNSCPYICSELSSTEC